MFSSLLRMPPTPAMARSASSPGLCRRLSQFYSPSQVSPLTRMSLPNMPPTQTPPVHCSTLDGCLDRLFVLRYRYERLGCRLSFSRLIVVVHLHCGLSVRLHACSPPRLTATQLARSSVLNRLIAPAGLPPVLAPASRAHHSRDYDSYGADYAAVAVEEEREVFAQASGVTCLICQLVIEGSLVSTSRR